MRGFVAGLFVLVALAAVVDAQPQDGDVLVCYADAGSFAQGMTLYFDPRNPQTVNTLYANLPNTKFHNWVRMAPNNSDIMIAEVPPGQWGSDLLSVTSGGLITTVAANVPGAISGIELDGDDTWVVQGNSTFLFGLNHTTGALTTYVGSAPWPTFNEVAIIRERGHTYGIANFVLQTPSPATPKIYSADRTGLQSTLVATAGNPLETLSGMEFDPRTGDFITTDFSGPGSRYTEPGGVEVNRVSLGGKVTTLISFGANGCRITQRDTVWVGGFQPGTTNTVGVLEFDLSTNTAITIITLPGHANGWPITGIEVYGSHPLTCTGQGGPGATINIQINSQNSLSGGSFYQIACSMGRRPGLKLANGEWLHLNALNDLFFLTAQNLVPTIFRNFVGKVNPFGSVSASVQLPQNFPSNLGITVFCAAVIYDSAGIVQVTNTHWFEI